MIKFVEKINNNTKKIAGAFTVALGTLVPNVAHAATSSFTGYTGITSDSVMNGFFSLLQIMGTFAGAFFIGTSIWGYVMSFKSEDTEARHKATLGFIPGIGFLAMAGIIALFKA